MQNGETTLKDVLEVIQTSFGEVDRSLGTLKNDTGALKIGVKDIHEELGRVRSNVEGIDTRVRWVEHNMVTKEYLDERLFDFKTELAMIMRKEDRKLTALVEELTQGGTLSVESAKRILSMELFPPIS